MSILIVEDNPVNARLLTLMLAAQGYQTVVARNGKEALATVAGLVDLQLIITDYMMPEMDGLEFIVKVRAMPAVHQVPILVASAHADHETVTRVQGLQCQGFLVKPIEQRQLLKRVAQLIRSHPRVLAPPPTTMERLNIGLEGYRELVNTFMRQLTDTMPIVVLEQGDSHEPISENLGQALKDLAESAALLGAEQFVQLYTKGMSRGPLTRSYCLFVLPVLHELDLALLASIRTQQKS